MGHYQPDLNFVAFDSAAKMTTTSSDAALISIEELRKFSMQANPERPKDYLIRLIIASAVSTISRPIRIGLGPSTRS